MVNVVFRDEEFDRIAALPRRAQIWSDEQNAESVKLVTNWLRRKGTTSTLMPIQARSIVEAVDNKAYVGLLAAGSGKAQPLDAVVYTPSGPKLMGDIRPGDVVCTPAGGTTEVLSIHPQGVQQVFRVWFSDGSSTECTDDHLWKVRSHRNRARERRNLAYRCAPARKRPKKQGYWEVLPLHEIRKSLRARGGTHLNFDVPITAPVDFSGAALPLSPYVVGVMLGDGCMSHHLSLSCGPRDMEHLLKELNKELCNTPFEYSLSDGDTQRIRLVNKKRGDKSADNIQNIFRSLGMWGCVAANKSISNPYKYAGIADRISLLQGLVDTDGYVTPQGTVVYYTISPKLTADVVELVQSLGGTVSVSEKKPTYRYKGEIKDGQLCYVLSIKTPPGVVPCRLPFKTSRFKPLTKYKPVRYITKVEEVGYKEVQCITVADPNHLYLTNQFVVTHNTLTSFLLPTALEVSRTLLLIPAKTRRQTFDVAKHWCREFHIHTIVDAQDGVAAATKTRPTICVQSYESLSSINYATFIDEYEPDLILCDEAHMLSRLVAGRSKRVFRYKRKVRPDAGFMPMTGTPFRKSIREAAPLFEAALGVRSPLPTDYSTLEQWSYALDEGVRDELRSQPGALLSLCSEEERSQGLDGVRRAVRRRMVESPGIVATTESAIDTPLTLTRRHITVPDNVRDAYAALRNDYALPNGDPVDAGLDLWRRSRELISGFVYRYDPKPPDAWVAAKKAWGSFARNKIDHPGSLRIDTPLQLWNLCESGRVYSPEWSAWKDIRDTFKINTVVDWLSDYLVRDAEDCALSTGGIVWVSHAAAMDDADDEALGKAFKRIPYFGGGDRRVETYTGPCAMSVKAHGVGLNLQRYSKALFFCMPSSGATLEQAAARTHRIGQQADQVELYFYAHCLEVWNAFLTARKDAGFMQNITGQKQRMLGSNIFDADGSVILDFDALPVGADPMDPLWAA